jgi:pimeloyl-ACP methyl ester carboxylesterase
VSAGKIQRENIVMAVEQRNGRINSGDVSLFYRAFGARGGTPILALHGSNYYDSYDWIGVAQALAVDREVVLYDRRGWGESTWSPSKDYSLDALVGDALTVAKHFGFDKPIVMGHSGAGPVVITLAVHFPDQLSRLVVVDSRVDRDEDAGQGPTVGNAPLMFESIEAAMARFARLANPPRLAHDRERAQHALIKIDDKYMLKRDPDNGNRKPIGEGAQMARGLKSDIWNDLGAIKCPHMFVRGLRSDRYPADVLARMQRDYPKIQWQTVDSQHDVPGQAPDALVAHVRKFIGAA